MQSSGRWQTLGVAAGLGAGPQVPRDPDLASEGVLRLCTLLSLVPLLPLSEPAGLLRLVIRREHHQHDLQQHQSQPDRRHPPSIRRAPVGACGKDMLPVLYFDLRPGSKILFQGNTPEGSDTFQRPVIERDRVGGLRLMIWDKVKVPLCHYSHALEESNL